MAIDYAIQFPCEVRRHLPEAKLQALVKQSDMVRFAIARFREAEPNTDLDTIIREREVVIAVRTPEGDTKQQPVTIAELMKLLQPLEGLKQACINCRANLTAQGFGCIGRVNYPLPAETEEWLLARLPADAKDAGLSLLFRFMADLDIDGAQIAHVRARPEILASRSPLTRVWKSLFSRKQIDSNQILYLLVYAGGLSQQQSVLYTQLLNLTRDHCDVVATPGITQFKAFLRAVVTAGRLGAPLSIDA